MLTIGFALTIFGLSIEIVGAFILAADSIGLKRLRNWSERIRNVRDDFDNPEDPDKTENRKSRGKRLNFFITLTITLVVTSAVAYTANISERESSLVVWAIAIGTGIVSGSVVLAGTRIMSAILRGSASFLSFVENKTKIKKAGIIGFGLLMFGFIMQLLGTIFQYVPEY